MINSNNIMVEKQIESEGINNPQLIRAMKTIDRINFVPENYKLHAYQDGPLPIGHNQTISQPYIVAYMLDAVSPEENETALEIGSGSGYLSCILSRMIKWVYSLEIIEPLYLRSIETIEKLGINNIDVYNINGYNGLPEKSPFDIIIVSCASDSIPDSLTDQLATGGRMIIPVEESIFYQKLILIHKEEDNTIRKRDLLPVRFVPFVKEKR